jgi:hypothetical protein
MCMVDADIDVVLGQHGAWQAERDAGIRRQKRDTLTVFANMTGKDFVSSQTRHHAVWGTSQ